MMRKIKQLTTGLIFLGVMIHGQVTGLSGWDICVDPGHSQTQNMGVSGFSEAEEVLRVGLQLRALLNEKTDIDTIYMTRTNDEQLVGLYDRSVYANTVGATWFHSIHSDASGSSSTNRTLLLWGQLYDGSPDLPVGGEGMADIMINILTRGMRISTTGSWGDCSFYANDICNASWPGPYLSVNRNTLMPSELSEEGHHTNPAQNQLDMNSEYQRLMGYTLFWSILKHQNVDRPQVHICTGIVRDAESGQAINGATVTIGNQTYITDTWESLFHQYTENHSSYRNGFYFLEDIPGGNWTVIASADGYDPDTVAVTAVDTFFTFKDIELVPATAPYIIHTIPWAGVTDFPAWDPIQIDFNRPMNHVSTEAAFHLNPETAGSFSWANQSKRLYFTPDSSLQFLTSYTMTVDSTARDAFGHPFDGNGDGITGDSFQIHFHTSQSDIFPPEIQSYYPPSGSYDVELNPIIGITFDELIGNPDTLDQVIQLQEVYSGSQVLSQLRYFNIGGKTIVDLFPSTLLTPQTHYIYRILPGISDNYGNVMQNWNSHAFVAGDIIPSIESIDDMENHVDENWFGPLESGTTTGVIPDSTFMNINSANTNLLSGSTSAMVIHYGWDEFADNWLVREYLYSGQPRDVLFTGNDILQCYVFGDGSGNQFRFAVDDHVPTDSSTYHEVSPWYTVNWIGWKRIRWDMSTDGTGTWLGDGNLDGDLRFDSFQLTHVANKAQFGHLIFDDLAIVEDYGMGISGENPGPTQFRLEQNYPNPFNPTTIIRFTMNRTEHAVLNIYNIKGQLVRNLVDDVKLAGAHSVNWDGKDMSRQPVSSGTYLYRLEVNGHSKTGKMVLLK